MTEPDDIQDLIPEFLAESQENLDRLDQELLTLERGEADAETLASIFRTVHSMKGACGFFGFHRLEALTHAGENLLARLRSRPLTHAPQVGAVLLRLVDAIRGCLASIAASATDGVGDDQALLAELATRATLLGVSVAPSVQTVTPGVESVLPYSSDPAPSFDHVPAGQGISEPAHAEDSDSYGSVADGYVRLDVVLLDKLMDLVGELVLARGEILELSTRSGDHALAAASQRLDFVTMELQAGVMKTRMQPIGSLWRRLPRMVRDLAKECGKEVRLETEGGETELDRTVIEAIKDPLTHIMRNAVDHGIETPDVRVRAGKRPEGCISLRATHEGGMVNIEVSDDGGGIAVKRVRDRSIARGIVTAVQADRMTDRELVNLVFTPGFSTAEKVTSVSGRGVGMDVVKTNVERIGGTLDLHNRPGRGTLLRIKIPLTLAIVPALIVESRGARYALPQVGLVELVRLEGSKARDALEKLFDVRVFRLRGKLLPVVFLRDVLYPAAGAPTEGPGDDGAMEIVVVQADDQQFGLVVDSVAEIQEIVVKPLGRLLDGLSVYAGATILGDGHVALILDVLGLAQRAGVVTELADRGFAARDSAVPEVTVPTAERQSMLVMSQPDGGRIALPLSQVARLEEIPVARIERAGGMDVVQYRGEILPLVYVSPALPERRRTPRGSDTVAKDTLQVVVYLDGARPVGLVVDSVVDVVEEVLTVNTATTRRGVFGTVTLLGRVTEWLDVPAILRSARMDDVAGEGS